MNLTVAVVALLSTVGVATAQPLEISVPKTEIQPHDCVMNQPVLYGWHTVATLLVHPEALALSLRTTKEYELQLKKPSYMNESEWTTMVESLANGGFLYAKAMVGGNKNLNYYFGISVSYEAEGERRCDILGSIGTISGDNVIVTDILLDEL